MVQEEHKLEYLTALICSDATEDEQLCKALVKHLLPLQLLKLITIWHEEKVLPGDNKPQARDKVINTASLILLLISPAFFDSDYCCNIAMPRALERY